MDVAVITRSNASGYGSTLAIDFIVTSPPDARFYKERAERFEREIADLERKLAAARGNLTSLLCDIAQIFDGWHADGTAWTEWDESVRKRVSEALAALTEEKK